MSRTQLCPNNCSAAGAEGWGLRVHIKLCSACNCARTICSCAALGVRADGAQNILCSSQAYQATLELSGAGAGAEGRTFCARARPAGRPTMSGADAVGHWPGDGSKPSSDPGISLACSSPLAGLPQEITHAPGCAFCRACPNVCSRRVGNRAYISTGGLT